MSEAQSSRTWRTDRMAFLDNPKVVEKLVEILNGAIPGTNKEYNAEQVIDELIQMIFAELQDAAGVHAETALATLGALAGFSVQMGLREVLIKPGKMAEGDLFTIIKTKNGETFYLGEALNEGLFAHQPGNLSVYSLVGGGAQHAGARELPDIKDIAQYVASTMGSESYGIPRMPAGRLPHERSIELLNKFWNPIRNHLAASVTAPLHWPLVLAHAAQRVIIMSKDSLDPALAGKLVMETAIAMAKVDPARIYFGSLQSP